MSEQQLENFAETQLYQRFRRMVDGNNASATDVRIENHESFNTIINHSSIWTFGVEISEDQIKKGKHAPYGAIVVNRDEYVTKRDFYAEQLKSDQNLQNNFISTRLALAKKNPLNEIKTTHKQIKTKSLIVACYYVCNICGGRGSFTCSKCGGKGSFQCPTCGGSGTTYRGGYDTISEFGKPDRTEFRFRNRTCNTCSGSCRVSCSHCSGSGALTCAKCGGSGALTHFIEIQGYAYPQRKYYVNGNTESERLLDQYFNNHTDLQFLQYVQQSTFKQYVNIDPHTVCFDYSSSTTIADLTFSIKGYEHLYRLRSYGNPIDLFDRCCLYDDLLRNEIVYTKYFYNNKPIDRKSLKADFKRFKLIPVLNQAMGYIAKHKKEKNDPNVGAYFSASCDYCISNQSAEFLGSFLNRVLNRVSPTGTIFLTILIFALIFVLFAIDAEHYFEAQYTGGFDLFFKRLFNYAWIALVSYIAFWIINRLVLFIRTRFIQRKFRQKYRDHYFYKYIGMLTMTLVLSIGYGFLARGEYLPKLGDKPYELKQEYVDQYLNQYVVEPSESFYHYAVPLVDQYVWQPLKSGSYIALDYADRYIWQTSRVGFVATKHWVYDDLLPWIGNVNDQGQKWIDSDVIPASKETYETSFPYFMEYVWDPALNAFSLVKKYSFSLLGIELPQPKIPEKPKALNLEQKSTKNATKTKRSSANKKSNKGRKNSTNR